MGDEPRFNLGFGVWGWGEAVMYFLETLGDLNVCPSSKFWILGPLRLILMQSER